MTHAGPGWWRERAEDHERYGEWREASECWQQAALRCQPGTNRQWYEKKAQECRARMERKPAVDYQDFTDR